MALGASTFTAAGGVVQDLFSIDAYKAKAAGNRIQAEEYDLAGGLARQNKAFTETSTAIKEMQTQRQITGVLGQQQADVAGSGFEASGSSLDLLRDSAAQGALHKAVLGQQGLIEEAGYEEQGKAYDLQAKSARLAAEADDQAATNAGISAGIKGAAAVATLFV